MQTGYFPSTLTVTRALPHLHNLTLPLTRVSAPNCAHLTPSVRRFSNFLTGFEPATREGLVRCSTRLSYRLAVFLGLEPNDACALATLQNQHQLSRSWGGIRRR
jgi:hypothetical protein